MLLDGGGQMMDTEYREIDEATMRREIVRAQWQSHRNANDDRAIQPARNAGDTPCES